MAEKSYRIKGPVGSIMIPKDVMTEKEIREFLPQLVQDADQAEIWKEKAEKDPFEDLVDWLTQAGYELTEV